MSGTHAAILDTRARRGPSSRWILKDITDSCRGM
jgi:hypothetical protein